MNNCNLCNEKTAPFKCGKCLKKTYCSFECQKKDWKTHKSICGAQTDADVKKTLMIVAYKGDISRGGGQFLRETMANSDNQIWRGSCEMVYSKGLQAVNPNAKSCWERMDIGMEIPGLQHMPYTMLFTVNNGTAFMFPIKCNNLQRDHSVEMRAGPCRLILYRTNDDKYIFNSICFVEN